MAKENHWRKTLISIDTTVIDAIKKLDESGWRILIVANDEERLLGVITDGDIRRYLLSQASLDASVELVMNKNPMTGLSTDGKEQLLLKMHSLNLLHLPILDFNSKLINLVTLDSLYSQNLRENYVIFMAGGRGKRLYPLTVDCPKPLIKIADKPISEILLENFIKSGFKNFIFSVNYKSEMVKSYYGNGSRWGVNIEYIEENDALGTAGSLSLLSNKPTQPIIVANADILTNINFGHILDFHNEQKNKIATLCVRQYQHTIPFGVVIIDEQTHNLMDMEEKPVKNYFINSGIYVLEPSALDYLNFNTYCDMPNFLIHLMHKGKEINTFPIREYWLDVGHHENLVKAASDYLDVFS